MFKNSFIMLKVFCLIGIFFFLWGCNSQTEAPQAPQVVSKKITKAPPPKPAPPKQPAKGKPAAPAKTEAPPKVAAVSPATPKPAAKPQPAPPKRPAEAKPPAPAKPETPPKAAAVSSAPAKKAEPPKPVPPPKKEAVKAPPPKKSEPPETVAPREKAQATPAPAARVKGAEKAKAPEVGGDETAEKEQPASQQKKDEKEKADAFQPIYLADVYDPTGKIDPFLPLYKEEPVIKKEIKVEKKIKRLPLTPLEKVDLSQLKLVGVINAPSGNKALVEEASGKGYIVKKGTYIGIHAGRVVAILSDRIVVEEQVETTLGTYQLQKRELKINKPPGEM